MKKFLVCIVIAMIVSMPVVAQIDESVIIRAAKPHSELISAIESLGGEVVQSYENFDAVAAMVPVNKQSQLRALNGVISVYKDVMVKGPTPGDSALIAPGELVDVISADEMAAAMGDEPQDYLFDNDMTGASTLHGNGIFGTGVIVAVIDSGTANVSSISGAVIGGENLVPGVGEPSATSTLNGQHGTWVGSTIAANIGFLFSSSGTLATAVATYAPGSSFPFALGVDVIPMVGSAPGASLYALKTFPAAGGGSPESRIIAAMDRAITLKTNFDNGVPSVPVPGGDGSEDNPFVYDSLNIQVVNMSLGGPTLFAGSDLEDLVTETMLDADIVLVASAGNEGHAAMTGGSPGTGRGSLTTGAASTAAHERILRDLQYGPGAGALYRPTDHTQTATFSSRGPTADGRIDPDVTANGHANYVQGAGGGISLVSGTSFSAPTVAGAAALLRQAHPGASARDIRDVLIDTANPDILGDDSADIDQGEGFIDLNAALAALDAGGGKAKKEKSHKPGKSVKNNIKKAGYEAVKFKDDVYTTTISDLLPGQVAHFFVESKKDTDSLTISIENIVRELPPGAQNFFFGDDIFLKVQDAVTSDESAPFGDLFIASDTTLEFDNPQTGLVRLGVMGDWTNAGRISADLVITRNKQDQGEKTAKGKVAQSESDFIDVEMPAGVSEAVFELVWKENWSKYPTDDVDMILLDPTSGVNFDGATLNSPERVEIASPMAGSWIVVVDGYAVHDVSGGKSDYEVRVTADGVRLEEE